MPLLLYRITGSEAPAGIYTSVSLVVSAVCQLGAGRLVDRIGVHRPILIALGLVTAAALLQGALAGNLLPLAAAGLLGAGAAWSISITMTTLVQQMSAEETRSRLLGITHVAWSGGFLAGNVMAGFVDRIARRPDLAFYLSAGGCALALLCALRVLRALKRGEASEGDG
jgi:MFS family permease